MQLSVTGRHMDIGDAFRQHMADKLEHMLGKYFGDAIDVAVTIGKEGSDYKATLSAHVGKHIDLYADGVGHDPYPAFDSAVEHLSKRLRRHKRRLRDHHKANVDMGVAAAYVLQPLAEDAGGEEEPDTQLPESGDAADAPPPVVAEMTTHIATLSVSEAVMRLDLTADPALLFVNGAHGGINMVYRRPDGMIGWVDPKNLGRG